MQSLHLSWVVGRDMITWDGVWILVWSLLTTKICSMPSQICKHHPNQCIL